MPAEELAAIGNIFELLAQIDFRGASPLYERLALDAAEDEEILALLLPVAPNDRMPHLLFAAVKYLLSGSGGDFAETFGDRPFGVFRDWLLDHRSDVEGIVATNVVQTNEVARCGALAPTLATVAARAQAPLAVIEVGASAGLNLLLDRYRYVYAPEREIGPENSEVIVRPRMEGSATPPLALPTIVWRRGLDRKPVNVMDDNAVRWLQACIWPEQIWRAELLAHAVTVARRDPPTVLAGDVFESLPDLVRSAPHGPALCVVHTAVAGYLPDRNRLSQMLADLSMERPLWWVSGEGPGLVPELPLPTTPRDGIYFAYGVVPLTGDDRQPVVLALAGAHGAWLEWLGGDHD